ncbi:HNH endonuclease [Noviherbaspirillum malthae]|uniref:HNH endonuclease n=1 Tax=Noviherbaspirillum malthae TaxID=1260987 RepID=UPI00188EE854|nr:HNH endonuclease [Noviherbaspirillum malthae]
MVDLLSTAKLIPLCHRSHLFSSFVERPNNSNLILTMHRLYQLSYAGVCCKNVDRIILETHHLSAMTIQNFRKDPRFRNCPDAFLVTGQIDRDRHNRDLLKKEQSGFWIVKEDRIRIDDLLFVLLPNPLRKDGYPRELYAGVIIDVDITDGTHNTLFTVEKFYRLPSIDAGITEFLNGNRPPQGNTALVIWENDQPRERRPLVGRDNRPEEEVFFEGEVRYTMHRRHERKPGLVRLAKVLRRERDERLLCEVCDFDFASVYGEQGDNFIEAHHKVPVSTLTEVTATRPEDLALVCSNCHSMLHRMMPLPTIEELRTLVQQRRAGALAAN